jgi:hypothetical protein
MWGCLPQQFVLPRCESPRTPTRLTGISNYRSKWRRERTSDAQGKHRHVLNQSHINKILSFEIASFLLVIALSWMSEMTELPHVMGAPEYISNWRESTLETLIVIFVAIPVLVITRRLLSGLHYLEGFLCVCDWCKKLNHNNEWIPLEDFFQEKFAMPTSHGMCSACAEKLRTQNRKVAVA